MSRWLTLEGPERKLLRGLFGIWQPEDDAEFARASPLRRAAAAPKRRRRAAEAPPAPLFDNSGPPPNDEGADGLAAPDHDPCVIDWALVYYDALTHGIGDMVASLEEITVDPENAQQIMRIRAARATNDLQTLRFWIRLLVAHCCRSPYSHVMCQIQKLKKLRNATDANNYLPQIPVMVSSVVSEFEVLLDDAASTTWKPAYDLASGSVDAGVGVVVFRETMEAEEVSELIFRCLTCNVTECLRRFQQFGLKDSLCLPWALLGIADHPSDEAAPARVELVKGQRNNQHNTISLGGD